MLFCVKGILARMLVHLIDCLDISNQDRIGAWAEIQTWTYSGDTSKNSLDVLQF